jgi:hypothetical protein
MDKQALVVSLVLLLSVLCIDPAAKAQYPRPMSLGVAGGNVAYGLYSSAEGWQLCFELWDPRRVGSGSG